MTTILKIYRWDLERARRREPLDLYKEEALAVPDSHDAARLVARTRAESVTGGRIRSCSTLAGPDGKPAGFAINIEFPKSR